MSKATPAPRSFAQVIWLWPEPRITNFASDIGVSYVTAQLMRHRDSINPDHWPAIVDAAKRRGIPNITLALLTELRAKRKRTERAAAS